jgi:hypothetical protein
VQGVSTQHLEVLLAVYDVAIEELYATGDHRALPFVARLERNRRNAVEALKVLSAA